MLTPTRDEQLRKAIMFKLYGLTEADKPHGKVLEEILKEIEARGYYTTEGTDSILK